MQTFTATPIRLGLRDVVTDRPFTAPEHSLVDAQILERMRAGLHRALVEAGAAPENPGAGGIDIQYTEEEPGLLHRLVILNRAALIERVARPIVGFFGQRRGETDPTLLEDIDVELVRELPQHPCVLSYSSLELDDGNWANLVILDDVDGTEHWRLSQKHAYAAIQLAPLYYRAIRLHNGVLPTGVTSHGLAITRTKYYDFGAAGVWRAIREERNSV